MIKILAPLRFIGLGLLLFFVYMFTPLQLNPFHDFSVVYLTNKAFLNGIPIYSYLQQVEFIKAITPPGFEFHPFPYPPWFSLITLFLGKLDMYIAAKVWSFINLIMAFAAIWFLTDGWSRNKRVVAIVLAVLFTPFLGLFSVGQFTGPIVLGSAIIIYANKKKVLPLFILGMFFLTFKPHLGGPIFLAMMIWIFAYKDEFGKKAMLFFIPIMGVVSAIGFIMDPNWIVNYPRSLMQYSSLPGVDVCNKCASLLAKIILLPWANISKPLAYGVAFVLILLEIIVLLKYVPSVFAKIDGAISVSIFAALLFLPYTMLYDYTLLFIPWIFVWAKNKFFAIFPLFSYLIISQDENGGFVLPLLCLLLFGFYIASYMPQRPHVV